MIRRTRAHAALVTGALAVTLLSAPPVSAQTPTAPPPVQDITQFCANPTSALFTDVPAANQFALAIRCLATAEITLGGPAGLRADQYGPGLAVTRGQMASFIARTLDAANARDRNRRDATFASQVQQLLPYAGVNRFSDVPDGDAHVQAVNRLAAAGIALGTGPSASGLAFSPGAPVTRGQMASFLNRAAAYAQQQDPARAGVGTGYTAPAGADYYADDQGSVHRANIDGITSVGISNGVGPATYGTGQSVTRAQMAGFLARSLSQLFDDGRTHTLLEILTGHFSPASRSDEARQVLPNEETTLTLNTRELAAGFVRVREYRITLVKCANVTRGPDDLVRFAQDGTTGLADTGAPTTRIVGVGDQGTLGVPPAGTTNSVAVTPGVNGSVRIRIRNDVGPECVVAVMYVNGAPGRPLIDGGESPRLEIDATGLPREPFGVSGATEYLSATPTGLPMTVMTRNLYLGTDITRPLRPAPEGVNPQIALANQVHEMRRIVGATDFPARAGLLAKEVVDTRPDVIGLQEVATWRTGPAQIPPPVDAQNRVIANATVVEFDFLQILLDELQRRGTPYEVINKQAQSDVEAPGFRGSDPFAPDAELADYRLTMHDVLLKRVGSPIVVEASGGANYDAVLPFELSDLRYEFIRGYNWADVRVGAERFRLLNTHLESQLSSFAMYQARELVAEQVTPSTRPVVMTCDCNTDPLDTSTKPGEPIAGIKHQDPYLFLTQHLDDAWLDVRPALPGFTSGLNELVDEPAPASFTHRIDFVMTRGVGQIGLVVEAGQVVGTDPANRAPVGDRLLWPSDHAGVVVRLRQAPISA